MRLACRPLLCFTAILLLGACLIGCNLQITATPTAETQTFTLTGTVHGGQSPVAGAHVFLFGTTGTGTYSLLSSMVPRSGYDSTLGATYTTTDSNGGFALSLSGPGTGNEVFYNCGLVSVYVLVLGGNPGLPAGSSNPALAEMANLSQCPTSGNYAGTYNVIQVTEVTTVAAVNALGAYMVSPYSVLAQGTGAKSQAGMINAFNTTANLASVSTGLAPAVNSNGGVVPQAKINTLANIIASCINSDGSTTPVAGLPVPPCGALFAAATADGTPTGTQPKDTVTALLNIAHHPAANVSALFALSSAAAPYQPALTLPPNDFTLSIAWPLLVNGSTSNPSLPSIDASGRVIVPGATTTAVTNVLSSLGAPVATSSGGFVYANRWSVDSNGVAWAAAVTGGANGIYAKLVPSTGVVTLIANGFTGTALAAAADANGNTYVADQTNLRMNEFGSTGTSLRTQNTGAAWTGIAYASPYGSDAVYLVTPSTNSLTFSFVPLYSGVAPGTGGGLSQPNSLAIDSSGAVWVTNGNNSLSKFTLATVNGVNTPIAVTGSPFTGGGLSSNTSIYPQIPIAMDGASNAWIPNYAGQSISQFTNAGLPVTPSTGYTTGCAAKGIAPDSSGNVWVTCDSATATNPLLEFIGIASPVATPILPGQFGTRPTP